MILYGLHGCCTSPFDLLFWKDDEANADNQLLWMRCNLRLSAVLYSMLWQLRRNWVRTAWLCILLVRSDPWYN